jgi:chemotaxis protein histidine kinase CheA
MKAFKAHRLPSIVIALSLLAGSANALASKQSAEKYSATDDTGSVIDSEDDNGGSDMVVADEPVAPIPTPGHTDVAALAAPSPSPAPAAAAVAAPAQPAKSFFVAQPAAAADQAQAQAAAPSPSPAAIAAPAAAVADTSASTTVAAAAAAIPTAPAATAVAPVANAAPAPKSAKQAFDRVPRDQVEPLLERLQLVQEIIRHYGRAYDYRVYTVRELENILNRLKAASMQANR